MFYKEKDQYYQIHIDECFVMGKITCKHERLDSSNYEGENAIYFYDRKEIWRQIYFLPPGYGPRKRSEDTLAKS